MEQARKLIKELKTLMGKTDTFSERRRDEIATWFKDNDTPENNALVDKFINDGVAQILKELKDIRINLDQEEIHTF